MACDLWTSLRADFQDSFSTLLKEQAKEVKDEHYYIIVGLQGHNTVRKYRPSPFLHSMGPLKWNHKHS